MVASKRSEAMTFLVVPAIICVSSLFLCVGAALAEENKARNTTSGEQRLQWWREARFGMFVHWGPVSLTGHEIGWSRGEQVPVEQYDQLYKSFNPVDFDAEAWVRLAKAAGMKYVVITAKHHDGFCLWDSAQTDYDVTATPFGRDILAELSRACRKHGVKFCVYYSICDWWHPDYPTGSPGGRTEKSEADMDSYLEYMYAQLAEIVDNYGPVGLMWFDGGWEEPWNRQRGEALYEYVKGLQEGIIVNDRVGRSWGGGDYSTPEQHIGAFNRDRPWETCMTLCRQWAWKPDDEMKSLKECIDILVRTVGGDGNLLLNVGPMPDGRIEPRQTERLQQIGRWLDVYGESIYGTRGGPFKPGVWGASTCNGREIYLHILDWRGADTMRLPGIDKKVTAAKLITGGDVRVEQTQDHIEVRVLPTHQRQLDTIVEFELDGPAFEIEPVDSASGSLASGKKCRASNDFESDA